MQVPIYKSLNPANVVVNRDYEGLTIYTSPIIKSPMLMTNVRYSSATGNVYFTARGKLYFLSTKTGTMSRIGEIVYSDWFICKINDFDTSDMVGYEPADIIVAYGYGIAEPDVYVCSYKEAVLITQSYDNYNVLKADCLPHSEDARNAPIILVRYFGFGHYEDSKEIVVDGVSITTEQFMRDFDTNGVDTIYVGGDSSLLKIKATFTRDQPTVCQVNYLPINISIYRVKYINDRLFLVSTDYKLYEYDLKTNTLIEFNCNVSIHNIVYANDKYLALGVNNGKISVIEIFIDAKLTKEVFYFGEGFYQIIHTAVTENSDVYIIAQPRYAKSILCKLSTQGKLRTYISAEDPVSVVLKEPEIVSTELTNTENIARETYRENEYISTADIDWDNSTLGNWDDGQDSMKTVIGQFGSAQCTETTPDELILQLKSYITIDQIQLTFNITPATGASYEIMLGLKETIPPHVNPTFSGTIQDGVIYMDVNFGDFYEMKSFHISITGTTAPPTIKGIFLRKAKMDTLVSTTEWIYNEIKTETEFGIINQTCTNAGTIYQLPANTCSAVRIKSRPTNTGYIYVYRSGITSSYYTLEAGDEISLGIDNTSKISVSSTVDGSVVEVIYE